ncbi:MAG: hypothetical protein K8R88_05160 [Armatimonadetes bacterium]|nr:hypothetical protein [Armatimonadota bacterium]
MYRVSKMMEMEYRLRKPKYDFISLPNILLNRMVLPELIQYQAVPETIGPLLKGLLSGPERETQLLAFKELQTVLGDGDPIGKTVELALK